MKLIRAILAIAIVSLIALACTYVLGGCGEERTQGDIDAGNADSDPMSIPGR